jgi:putative membrane protein
VLVALGVLVLFPALFMGVGMMGIGGMMGGHMWGGGGATGWFPLLGLVMQLLFLFVVVVGAYLVYRAVAGDGEAGDTDPAIEELRSAYARGELSDEEYENRREALERDRQG